MNYQDNDLMLDNYISRSSKESSLADDSSFSFCINIQKKKSVMISYQFGSQEYLSREGNQGFSYSPTLWSAKFIKSFHVVLLAPKLVYIKHSNMHREGAMNHKTET